MSKRITAILLAACLVFVGLTACKPRDTTTTTTSTDNAATTPATSSTTTTQQ